jgi:hypothetical protein
MYHHAILPTIVLPGNQRERTAVYTGYTLLPARDISEVSQSVSRSPHASQYVFSDQSILDGRPYTIMVFLFIIRWNQLH